MTIAPCPMTLEQYLNFEDGTETRYELVDGVLEAMPTESTLNTQIIAFLLAAFLQAGIPYTQLGIRHQIAVSGARATAREPDLMIHSTDSVAAIQGRSHALLTHDMPPPALVVEVVSPNQENRDYRHKRTEYAARHIPEYWIVDPLSAKVTVLIWVDGLYEETVFQGRDRVISLTFPQLTLSATQILQAGMEES